VPLQPNSDPQDADLLQEAIGVKPYAIPGARQALQKLAELVETLAR
jgi:hypothetical protein